MKKIFSFIVLLAGVAMFTACSDNDTENPYARVSTISVEKAEVYFDANGGTGSIQVSSPTAVSVSVPAEFPWVTASASGNTINLSVAPSTTIEGRSAQLSIKNSNDEVFVTVSQTGMVARLDTYELYFSDAKGTQAIGYKTDVPVNWKSLDDWVAFRVDEESNTLLVGVASNENKEERVGRIVLEGGDYSDTLFVYQDAMVFELETTSVMFSSNNAGSAKVKVDHSKPVTVQPTEDWLTASFNDKDSTVVVEVAANGGDARLGYVAVMSGTSVEYLTVGQFDFAQEVSDGYYFFWYMDASDNDWHYMPALLNGETMFLGLTDDIVFSIPVSVSVEDKVLYAGPSTSFAGNYDPYFIYWVWRTLANTWSGYTGKTYSVGEFDMYQSQDGGLVKSIMWGGNLGKNTIDAWALRAMKAEGLNAENNAGYLATFYFPQMEKYEDGKARDMKSHGVRTFNGHTGTRAGEHSLQFVLRK